MKIEWLNDDMTEARITRGWFKKRVATVKRGYDYSYVVWAFVGSGARAHGLRGRIERARRREEGRRQQARDWKPVERDEAIPVARLVTPSSRGSK